MLGMQVNTYIPAGDYSEAVNHRRIASKMDIIDIIDIVTPQTVLPIAVRDENMPDLDQSSDEEAGPSLPKEALAAQDEPRDLSAGLYILGTDEAEAHIVNNAPFAVPEPRPSPFGTPTSRVGFLSTSPRRVLHVRQNHKESDKPKWSRRKKARAQPLLEGRSANCRSRPFAAKI